MSISARDIGRWVILLAKRDGTVAQASGALSLEARDPFGNRLGRGVEAACGGRLAQAVVSDGADHILSLAVRRALLWVFIRSPGVKLVRRNFSFPGPDRMDNLLKVHI